MVHFVGSLLVVCILLPLQAIAWDVTTEGCGVTKGCFRSPQGCDSAETCELLATYKLVTEDPTLVQFELSGQVTTDATKTPYIALGITSGTEEGKLMYGAYTMAVFWNDTVKQLQVRDGATLDSPKRGHNFLPVVNDGVTDIQVQSRPVSATIQLFQGRFKRARARGTNPAAKDLTGNQTYYLIAATADKTSPTGLTYHASAWHTDSAVSINQYTDSTGSDRPQLMLLIHGSLMIIAWLGLCSVGVMLPSHFRLTLAGRSLFGNKLWLQLHRFCQIGAALITIAAFIVAVVSMGTLEFGYGIAGAHSIIGIVVMALIVTNIVFVFLRPKPTGDNAKTVANFTTAHMVAGRLIKALSITNIILGLLQPVLRLPMWPVYAVAAVVTMSLLFEVFLFWHTNFTRKIQHKPLDEPEDDECWRSEITCGKTMRIALLICYCVVVFAVVAVLVVEVFAGLM